jgi:mannose-6-phosphate isomerase
MACALTTFEALCSFRPPSEIASNIKRVPELVFLIGGNEKAAMLKNAADVVTLSKTEENIANFALELKTAYSTLMAQPIDVVAEAFSLLKNRLEKEAMNNKEEKSELVQQDESNPFSQLTADACALRLCSQYPGDVGVFSPFLFNVITLQPGDAIFLGANEPHAYLSGDCIEIMACSDNVVRAGLTPKFKDVSILCEMLTYKCGQPEILKGTTFQKIDGCIAREYTAPVPEFMLQQFLIPKGESQSSLLLPSVSSAAVLIVINGSGIIESLEYKDIPIKRISQGQVLLQHAGTQMTLSSSNTDKDLLVFRASVAAS